MKLEVGMYVRTKRDGIGRIISLSIGEEDDCCFIELSNRRTGIKERNILKASHSLLGNNEEPCLIEVGDYVNGKLVEDIFEKTNYADKSIKLKGSSDYWYNEHIKTVVTKEQFESMSYKVD